MFRNTFLDPGLDLLSKLLRLFSLHSFGMDNVRPIQVSSQFLLQDDNWLHT